MLQTMTKRLVPSVILALVFCLSARAQCNTSNPNAITCPNTVTTAQLNTAIAAANDGAIFTFAAGTYTGIVGQARFSPSKGATFICATPPPSGTTSITAWSITSNVVTFTAANSFVAGQVVGIQGFPTSTFLNHISVTVIATGLSGSQFEANLGFTRANGSATESGTAFVAGAAVTNPCLINSNGSVFGSDTFNGTVTKFYRISGFTFDLQGSGPSTGTIYWSSFNSASKVMTLTQVRVDHNTFQNGSTGAQTTLIGDTAAVASVYGVYDHNLYNNATQFTEVIWISGISTSTAFPSVQLGTGNNLFLEDNILNFAAVGNASAEGCTDGWGLASFVVRHNTSTNCLWASHGETHQGGPANWEVYNNFINMDNGSVASSEDKCFHCFHSQGSGTFAGFNNVLRAPNGHDSHAFVQAHYRGGAGQNGSFSVTAVTVGTPPNITYTGTFPACTGAGACVGWWNFSGFGNAGNNTFTQITSANATTVTGTTARSLGTQVTQSGQTATGNISSVDGSAPQCDGTVASPSTLIWSLDGNRLPLATNRGYPCFNQPGRDYQGNYHPQYAWNNLWFDDGSQVPFTIENNGGNPNYYANQIVQNRDFYDAVSNVANSSPTSPFNGSTGTGFGLFANIPTTCTTSTETAFGHGAAGTAYFATNVGPQGTLYTCSATNTFTVYYTPYTYPHPLVGGGSAATPTFSPGAGTYPSAQTVTISTTTTGAIICWNTTGNPSTNGLGTACNNGTLINGSSGNITVSVTETVYAVAGTFSLSDSPVGSAGYTITTASPSAPCAICLMAGRIQ